MEADRLDGLFAACADASDDLAHVISDGVARRRRRLREPIGDGVAMEPDRSTACSPLALMRATTSSTYSATALRFDAEVSESRSAMESPWKRIASTACSPLALTRATTSSAYSATAFAPQPTLSESIGDRVAVETDRLNGLFAACADAATTSSACSAAALRVVADVSEARSTTVSPWRADRLNGLFAACADAGDDPVRVFGDCVARRRRGLCELVSDPIALGADRLDRLSTARARSGDDLVRVCGDGAACRRRGLASWSATDPPWSRIVSTVCVPA